MKKYTVEEIREILEKREKEEYPYIYINKMFVLYEEYKIEEEKKDLFFQGNGLSIMINIKDIKEIK